MRRHAARIAMQARQTLPEGTGVVGAGLAVAALTSYVFVIVSLNALQGNAKAAFSAYWAVIFVAGPGFFLPLEQEVGRALAHRRAQGLGGGPLVHRAARLGGIITAVMVVASIASTPLLNDQLYHGDMWFVAALAIGLVGFYAMHLTRGTLAGQNRFRAYGLLIGAEGVIRLVGGIGLASLGVDRAGGYAMVLALAPFLAVAIALWRQKGLLQPGPVAPYSELSKSLTWLLLASVLTQLLAYSALLGINILSSPSEKDIAAAFASAFFIARVPVLAFQAVQGTLLPKLAGPDRRRPPRRVPEGRGQAARGGGRHRGARHARSPRSSAPPSARSSSPTSPSAPRGSRSWPPAAVCSSSPSPSPRPSWPWAATGSRRWPGVWAWWCAWPSCSSSSGLELRVELGFMVGAAVATVAMAAFTWTRMSRAGDSTLDGLIEAIEHEPIEI